MLLRTLVDLNVHKVCKDRNWKLFVQSDFFEFILHLCKSDFFFLSPYIIIREEAKDMQSKSLESSKGPVFSNVPLRIKK